MGKEKEDTGMQFLSQIMNVNYCLGLLNCNRWEHME